ncbi:MAG: twitching motility protein PilT [Candidatus Cloacimonadota bacterium]|nr:MAG: twitching motility protein PilT [Candidatus Cloacimonadota bacterium]
MYYAYFRFYEELNYFLPLDKRKVRFIHYFKGRASIKDMIEAIGVPHPEVDLILINGKSVDFSYIVQHQDEVSVYPVFESLDISKVTKLREKPLRNVKFILDVHLGKLAVYLRIFGFDVLYRNNFTDNDIVHIIEKDNRILLTKDRGLLKRKIVTHGYCVREINPKKQAIEIVKRFDLFNLIIPFSRCVHCNTILVKIEKQEIIDKLLPRVKKFYNKFSFCPNCQKIYWQGSHYQSMMKFIEKIINSKL